MLTFCIFNYYFKKGMIFMLNFVLSKTLFRKSPHAKELSELNHEIVSTQIVTFIIYLLLLSGPIFFIVLPLTLSVKTEVPVKNQILLLIPLLTYYVIVFIFMKYFKDELLELHTKMQVKLHFNLYSIKGEVITKPEFQIIKNTDEDLYFCMRYNKVTGLCISSCFHILKYLKNGEIWFIAAKYLSNDQDLPYYFHVIYVKNNWLFDTETNQQFPIDNYENIRQFKVYKKFTFQEIEHLEYKEFLEKERPGIDKWCAENNCLTLEASKETQDCE